MTLPKVFEDGQRVVVNTPGESEHGEEGSVVGFFAHGYFRYEVQLDNGRLWRFRADELVEV